MASIKQRLAGLERQAPRLDLAEAIKRGRERRASGKPDWLDKAMDASLIDAAAKGDRLAGRTLRARQRMVERGHGHA